MVEGCCSGLKSRWYRLKGLGRRGLHRCVMGELWNGEGNRCSE